MPKKIKISEAEFREGDEEGLGFCIACGEEAYGCEPDAEKYECESCGKRKVYGASQLLQMGLIEFVED